MEGQPEYALLNLPPILQFSVCLGLIVLPLLMSAGAPVSKDDLLRNNQVRSWLSISPIPRPYIGHQARAL